MLGSSRGVPKLLEHTNTDVGWYSYRDALVLPNAYRCLQAYSYSGSNLLSRRLELCTLKLDTKIAQLEKRGCTRPFICSSLQKRATVTFATKRGTPQRKKHKSDALTQSERLRLM